MEEMEFTREDIVRHLAELGYANVEESKLDSFCSDLRRLIKYEEKKRRVGEKLEQLERSQRRLEESQRDANDSSTTPEVARRKRRIRREDKKKAKEEKMRAKYGDSTQSTAESSNHSNRRTREDLSSSVREVETSSEREEVDNTRAGHCPGTSVSSGVLHDDPSSLYIDVDLPPSRPSSSSLPLAASLLAQPAAGFIRVRSGPSVGRRGPDSDPVALHQRYRDQWARANIPGEKRHDKLRWAVRGWMMGEEPT